MGSEQREPLSLEHGLDPQHKGFALFPRLDKYPMAGHLVDVVDLVLVCHGDGPPPRHQVGRHHLPQVVIVDGEGQRQVGDVSFVSLDKGQVFVELVIQLGQLVDGPEIVPRYSEHGRVEDRSQLDIDDDPLVDGFGQ